MMWNSLKYLFLVVCGTSFGALAAAGVFTVLAAVGLVPRFAGRTHTGNKVLLYEDMIIAGTTVGGLVSVFTRYCHFGEMLLEAGIPENILRLGGTVFLTLFGVFAGMFVGCLALAIAEMLDSIPIFARRTGFRHGLGIAVCSMAVGKVCGSLFYFFYGLHDAVK